MAETRMVARKGDETVIDERHTTPDENVTDVVNGIIESLVNLTPFDVEWYYHVDKSLSVWNYDDRKLYHCIIELRVYNYTTDTHTIWTFESNFETMAEARAWIAE